MPILQLLASLQLMAQPQPGFAGTWIIDHSKSDAEFKDYSITCNITENAQVITVEQVFLMQDGQKTSMQPITYNIGGKPVSKEQQGGTDNISANLSADKKVLTTKFVRTMNGNSFGSLTTYTLSDDGKVLTIKTSDLTGDSPMIQVYIKK